MRPHDILYFVGFISYIFALFLVLFGIVIFFIPQQAIEAQNLGNTAPIFSAIIYSSGFSIMLMGLSLFVSGAMFVAFADLVRSNIRSEENLVIMTDMLERRRNRR